MISYDIFARDKEALKLLFQAFDVMLVCVIVIASSAWEEERISDFWCAAASIVYAHVLCANQTCTECSNTTIRDR